MIVVDYTTCYCISLCEMNSKKDKGVCLTILANRLTIRIKHFYEKQFYSILINHMINPTPIPPGIGPSPLPVSIIPCINTTRLKALLVDIAWILTKYPSYKLCLWLESYTILTLPLKPIDILSNGLATSIIP